MRKIIAMIGVPAVGKSTIMRKFLQGIPDAKQRTDRDYPLVPHYESVENRLYILGKDYETDEKFPGTDRYSMAVQPEAVEFVSTTSHSILFEGDRLNTTSFLEHCAGLDNVAFKILVITASRSIIDARHHGRADTQSETFKKGRETKIDNVQSNFLLMDYITTFENNKPADAQSIADWLHQELKRV